jgi:hypothetical protein
MKDVASNISTDLIDLAARHVAGMRLIKNVRNEFSIFKRRVIDTGDLDLRVKPTANRTRHFQLSQSQS